MRAEIQRLEGELRVLRDREEGVLGELERLGTELRLRETESAEVSLRLEEVEEAIATRDRRVGDLERIQERRRRYLSFRLREIYKDGPDEALRRFIGGESIEDYWSGLGYAAFLSERDGRVLREFRADAEQLVEERRALEQRREELGRLDEELTTARRRLEGTRRRRSRLLREIQDDKTRRESAVEELRAAADALGELVGSFPASEGPDLDVRKFRGLLDWPAAGQVSAGFGTIVHPRFKTRVPHPGLDIDAVMGADIRSVFDGSVVFASWMRGYGLTAIVDHGGGVLSVYAHASVLLVEPGESVLRGQSVGKVGESGSLRGPYLYFELRVDGRPTDPRRWLRSR